MTMKDDMDQKLWEEHIGALPKGFFIRVSNSQLSLYYRGPGYKELTEPGGKKPTGDCAYICMHSIFYMGPESLKRLETEVPDFIQEEIRRTREELSG